MNMQDTLSANNCNQGQNDAIPPEAPLYIPPSPRTKHRNKRLLFIPLHNGHGLGPLIRNASVALEAQSRGHIVRFLCKKSFGRILSRLGIPHSLIRTIDETKSRPMSLLPRSASIRDDMIYSAWTDPIHFDYSIQAELKMVREFKPDVLITELQPSVPVTSKLTGIPWGTFANWAMHTDFKTPLYNDLENTDLYWEELNKINRLLSRYKLKALSDLADLHLPMADFCFAPTIPEIEPALLSMKKIHFVGRMNIPELHDKPIPDTLLRTLEDSQKPIIFAYMSTSAISGTEWFSKILETFREKNVLVVISSTLLPAEVAKIAALPSNFVMEHNIPTVSMLKYCSLVLSHGGGNITIEALHHAVPQIILSGKDYERNYNGLCIEEAGAGLCYENFPSTQSFFEASQNLINSTTTKKNCLALAKKISEAGGRSRAVDIIEQRLAHSYQRQNPGE